MQISKICASRYKTWFNFWSWFCKSAYVLTLGVRGGVSLSTSGEWKLAAKGSQCVAVAYLDDVLATGSGTGSWSSVKILSMEICGALSPNAAVSEWSCVTASSKSTKEW